MNQVNFTIDFFLVFPQFIREIIGPWLALCCLEEFFAILVTKNKRELLVKYVNK